MPYKTATHPRSVRRPASDDEIAIGSLADLARAAGT